MARSKDAGFTLLELLVVIVILGIVTSFMYLSVSNVGASAAKHASGDMQYILSRCRSACLSRTGESFILLKQTAEGAVAEYYEGDELQETKELGGARVACRVDGAELTEEKRLSFERSTGAVKTGGEYSVVSSIVFSGGGADYTVSIVPETGTHSVS